MSGKRFHAEKIDETSLKKLSELARLARGDILKMTTLAASGHPGGSMSSIDFYLILYSYANVDPESPSESKYEDHHIQTGLGSLVAGVLADHGLGVRFRRMGITRYGASGKPDDLYKMEGLDVQSLVTTVINDVQQK